MLDDFQDFLSRLGTIPEKRINFYVLWVRRFLKFFNYQIQQVDSKQVSQYLDSLDADEKVADWQVKQAADAVFIYLEQFLKKSLNKAVSLTNDDSTVSKNQRTNMSWPSIL